MEATTTATTTTIIQTTSATVAAPLELTVSGASVNATEVKKKMTPLFKALSVRSS